jgi:2-dehydro-3-deoxyphosphogalactonate aldolase
MSLSHPTTPLVAILRGLKPAEAVDVAKVLHAAGFRALEVPLNRPGALECIADMVKLNLADTLVGGGTMLNVGHVEAVYEAGGRLLVSPNCNPAAIRRAADLGMYCAPGVATPTEAFIALKNGADVLKMFPAEQLGCQVVKAWRAVIAAQVPLVPVGGIAPDNMGPFLSAGANGFGLGSALYKPGQSAAVTASHAKAFINGLRVARAGVKK